MSLSPNDRLGPYIIIAPIGAGGMGEVFRAKDPRLGRDVALKILPVEMSKDPGRLARFQREARSVAALNHPNIVTLYTVEESDGYHFLTMELVEGQSLDVLIPNEGFPVEGILEMGTALAEALAAAHDKGLVHRDLKPANIMVTREGRIKVLDFGLAKDLRNTPVSEATVTSASETQLGVVMGTPPYMSPEQISGRPLDYRTDLFSLGVILHQMTTGRRPFHGKTSVELAAAILRDNPPPIERSDIPSGLRTLIDSCLAKNADDRIPSAQALSQGLEQTRRNLTHVSTLPAEALAPLEEAAFRLCVLPFKLKGSNADLEALAEGLGEEIVAGLSRFSYMKVIAPSTSGKQLPTRFVMEGSLRQAGSRLRVSVQLTDSSSGTHLWAENYERTFSPEAIFELQDELVPRIVSTVADMNGILPRTMSDSLRARSPEQLSPYEAVLRSFGYFERVTPQELAQARAGLAVAVQKNPSYSDAWAMLGILYAQDYGQDFMLDPDCLAKALASAEKAIDASTLNPLAYFALATAHFFRKDFSKSRGAAERCVSLNPMDGNSIACMAELATFSGEYERGIQLSHRARQLNPNHPGWYWYSDFVNAFRLGDYGGALQISSRFNMPGHWASHMAIAVASAHLGDHDTASKAVGELLRIRPDFGFTAKLYLLKWFPPEIAEPMLEGLRKAGLKVEGQSVSTLTPSGRTGIEDGFWVAVLPFKSSSAEITSLAEGLSEEVVTGLSRFSYLRVIARGSTLRYASQSTDLRTIGKELGAHYLMEGSLRLAGARLRVAVQLVDTTTGAQLWADTYERAYNVDLIFELQDDLVPRIVSTVADHDGVLPQTIAGILREKNEDDLSAHEAMMRSFSFFKRFTPEEHAIVRRILEATVIRAPGHADCWAMLSHLYCTEYWVEFNPRPEPLGRALGSGQRAVDLAPTNHLAYWALALALFLRRDYPASKLAAERSIELNPMDGSAVAFMGHLIAYSGDWERGCAIAEPASALNPQHAGWHRLLPFFNAYRKGDYREALAAAQRINTPNFFQESAARAAAYGQLGDREAARRALDELFMLCPDFAAKARNYYSRWQQPELVERLIDGLRKAGLEISDSPPR